MKRAKLVSREVLPNGAIKTVRELGSPFLLLVKTGRPNRRRAILRQLKRKGVA